MGRVDRRARAKDDDRDHEETGSEGYSSVSTPQSELEGRGDRRRRRNLVTSPDMGWCPLVGVGGLCRYVRTDDLRWNDHAAGVRPSARMVASLA